MSEKTVLSMRNISKHFPGVLALDNVDFQLEVGEVHVLLGENGAGKSTLMKILSGAYSKDNGQIFLDGNEIDIRDPKHAIELGIGTIYQEFNLSPSLVQQKTSFLEENLKHLQGQSIGRRCMKRGKKRSILLDSILARERESGT